MIMKTKIILVAFTLIMVMGCRKPNQCDSVSPYAPFEISWTDYNSLDSVREYFDCHDSMMFWHYHDSVKVKGYFVHGYRTNSWFFRNSKMEKDTSNWVFVTGGVPPDADTNRKARVVFKVESTFSPHQYPSQPYWMKCCKWPLSSLHFVTPQRLEYEED